MTGIQWRSALLSAIFAVRIARRSKEVYTTEGKMLCSTNISPPRFASASPFSVRSTSTQPVNWLDSFQVDWPWRKRISFPLVMRSEEHTSELQSRFDLVCRLLLEK